MRRCLALLLAAACGGSPSDGDDSCRGDKCDDPGGGDAAVGGCEGSMPAAWISGGPDCPGEPVIQIHQYDPDTFILRQSLCTSFEAPFMYLLFGEEKALLEDTGAGGIEIGAAVEGIIADWLAENGKDSIELVVVNSHAHGDHVAGNDQFAAHTVVGFTIEELSQFFALPSWPDGRAAFDLGSRVIDVMPIPGHQGADIALFDRSRGLLLTGDTVYPGHLFIREFADYLTSIRRLVALAGEREICRVLGAHIEMSSAPGEAYDFGVTFHPDEHELQLGAGHLVELEAALTAMEDSPVEEVHDDFVITPL
jgi:hydroxyacylglutathione hydrolase